MAADLWFRRGGYAHRGQQRARPGDQAASPTNCVTLAPAPEQDGLVAVLQLACGWKQERGGVAGRE